MIRPTACRHKGNLRLSKSRSSPESLPHSGLTLVNSPPYDTMSCQGKFTLQLGEFSMGQRSASLPVPFPVWLM